MRSAPGVMILVLGALSAALASNVDTAGIRMALTIGAVVATFAGGVRAWSMTSAVEVTAPIVSAPVATQEPTYISGRGQQDPIFDPATGLCTDWYFRLRLEEEIQRAARFGQRFTVVLVSVGAGRNDIALRLGQLLRHVDYAADLGGTVAVALPNTDTDGALKWHARFDTLIPADVRIAEYPRDGETVEHLLGEHSSQRSDARRSAA